MDHEVRTTHFPVVPLPKKLRAPVQRMSHRRPRRILSIAYDKALRETRHLLLQSGGYEVTSIGTRTHAVELCRRGDFDLVIVGTSVPQAEKVSILREIRSVCAAPVLVLRSPGESTLPDVNYDLAPGEGPAPFLAAVDEIFRGRRTRTRPD
ncbi:MAG TPA: hypothetical protein VL382_03505 [Terriglobales bacterium]|nr:hypothetical protein [Terriglobales bacterium]